jgi:hypothetical protein
MLEVDLTSGDTALGGNNTIEDGMPEPSWEWEMSIQMDHALGEA